MQGVLNHLSPEYIKEKREVMIGITIMIEEKSRIEKDHIIEIGLVDHHIEARPNLNRTLGSRNKGNFKSNK